MNLPVQYFNLKKTRLFFGILLLNLVIIWLSKALLINETVFYNTYSEQLTYERSLQLFENLEKLSWISYAFLPVLLILKFTFISIVIYTGIFFFNLHYKVTFASIFKVVMASEIIFIFAGLLKILWFYFFAGNYDINELGFFYPLSLSNLFKISEVNKIWIYPLQAINIFQFIYMISLSYGLSKISNIDKNDSDRIVLSSYLPAMSFWIVLIMFLSIDSAV
jgi:hypothetical protein